MLLLLWVIDQYMNYHEFGSQIYLVSENPKKAKMPFNQMTHTIRKTSFFSLKAFKK